MRREPTVSEVWCTRLATALALMLACDAAALAHHSFASLYDTDKRVTLAATVREFQFIQPHPFLIVESRNEAGAMQTWRAEMDNRFELEEIGITRSTFQRGDQVIVSGSPGRTQPFIMYLWRLDRPADQLRYQQVGGTPSLGKAGAE